MKRNDFAKSLSGSISTEVWIEKSIEEKLKSRLPDATHHLIKPLVSVLFFHLPKKYAPSSATIAKALLDEEAFHKLWVYCQKNNTWPNSDLEIPKMNPVGDFAKLSILELPTLQHLAEWLDIPPTRLDYLADVHEKYETHKDNQVHHYNYIIRDKKTKGVRVIEAPKVNLKSVQLKILRCIIEKIPSHPDSFGFVKGRNCIGSANRHAGEEVVISFDLKNFFPSITAQRIFGLFRNLGYPNQVSRYLTALCSNTTPSPLLSVLSSYERQHYKRPHLPQGSPASPALANHVAYRLDCRLSKLARSLNANYSRYADDITCSGDSAISGTILRVVPKIVKDEGFILNHHKTRIMRFKSRQTVTGVVVNQHLTVSRGYYDRIKAIIYACGKREDSRLEDEKFRASLLGKISWVETVNPARGLKLRILLENVLLTQDKT